MFVCRTNENISRPCVRLFRRNQITIESSTHLYRKICSFVIWQRPHSIPTPCNRTHTYNRITKQPTNVHMHDQTIFPSCENVHKTNRNHTNPIQVHNVFSFKWRRNAFFQCWCRFKCWKNIRIQSFFECMMSQSALHFIWNWRKCCY